MAKVFCIGLLGFGEVGRIYASELLKSGIALRVYHPAPRPETVAAANKMGVSLISDASHAFDLCDLILNVAPGAQALRLARIVAPHLKHEALFADLSSASPDDLRAAAAHFPTDRYVDVAILGAVSIHRRATPLLASGAGAARLRAMLEPLGFTIDVMKESRPGDATTLKLLRSILTKGMDAVIIECLLAAESLGLREALLANLGDLDQSPLSELIAMFVRTHGLHAARRLEEVRAIEEMLKDVDVPLMMTAATGRRYAHSLDILGAAGPAHGSPPQPQVDGQILAWMLAAERRARQGPSDGDAARD